MPFNSFTYLLFFLPAVALLVALARGRAGATPAKGALLIASLVFYGWSKPSSLPLLVGSIVVNWAVARWMAALPEGPRRRRALIVGLVLDIGFLASFKYVNFVLRALPLIGLPRLAIPDWEFPLGVSFFTLAQVMYLVDCYEGLVPASSLLDHATFVSFFPYVISGPIARAKNVLKQLHELPAAGGRADQAAKGLYLISLGLFKKVVFADSFGRVADLGFTSPAQCSTLEAWVVSACYTLQIYFDFSGYSDMALGSARVLGIEIPKNFNAPLRSRTVTEFWQRWHISLSGFITTYLYTPILQSFRKATLGTAAIATMISMTIAGLWHGPSWSFILFGAMHGAALAVNQVWKKNKKKRRLPGPLALALTLCFVNLAFIFFRAPDLRTAVILAGKLVPIGGHVLGAGVIDGARNFGVVTLLPPMIAGAAAAFVGKTSDELANELAPRLRNAAAAAAMILVAFVYMNSTIGKQFVYFNF